MFMIECVVQDDVELAVGPCLDIVCGGEDPEGMVEAAHVEAVHDVLPGPGEGRPLQQV